MTQERRRSEQPRRPGVPPGERVRTPEGPWRVQPELARYILAAALNPRAYDPSVGISYGNDRAGIRTSLLNTTTIDVRPVIMDYVAAKQHQGAVPRDIPTRQAAQEKLARYITQSIARHRTDTRDIDLGGLRADLLANRTDPELGFDPSIRINGPFYAAMGQAVMLLPPGRKELVIDAVLDQALFMPATDQKMFARLGRHAEAIDQERRDRSSEQRPQAVRGAQPSDRGDVQQLVGLQRERPRRRRPSRRQLLRGAGAAGALAFGGWLLSDFVGGGKPELDSKAELERFRNPFGETLTGNNREANDIAHAFGINEGSFWQPDERVLGAIGKTGAFLSEQSILPIFPATIAPVAEDKTEQQKALVWASNNTDSQMPTRVPVNVLATVATIESAGNPEPADSGADAYGMMQVVPGFHLDKIVTVAQEISGQEINGEKIPVIDVQESSASLQQWQTLQVGNANEQAQAVTLGNQLTDAQNALKNPYVASKVGALILQENYLEAQREQRTPPLTSAVDTWVVALGEYNGGQGILNKPVSRVYGQTQLYERHAQRFFMTAEIAAQLRKRGMQDPEIARQLISFDTNARGYAYQHVIDNPQLSYTPLLADMANENASPQEYMKGYTILWNAMATPTIMVDPDSQVNQAYGVTANAAAQLTSDLQAAYAQYLTDTSVQYQDPLSPGLRMWINHGGYNLFSSVPDNLDPARYPANQSS